ncbi:cytochrome P450 [Nocardia sp. NPDC051030]|uniref:cytochrome P450 n=1 Tax=Nocardia sp. NPDC051030 TaxID=3155162 RepID=UPI00342BB99D
MREFPRASALEGIRFTTRIGIPRVASGLFVERPIPARIAAACGADRRGYRLVEKLVHKYGPAPFRLRVGRDEVLLVHHPEDLRFVLERSPDPFASDPGSKRAGMAAFQPEALTLSRGTLWQERRRFADSILDTGHPVHRLAGRFVEIANAETDLLLARSGGNTLCWKEFHQAFQRITRRVIFGAPAADDTALSELLEALMAAGNRLPGAPAPRYPEFIAHIERYLTSPPGESLAALIATAPPLSATEPAGQLVHWMFAMGDTLAVNAFRALAALIAHPEQLRQVRDEVSRIDGDAASGIASSGHLAGSIYEAMRLWPTTPMFGRESADDVEFPSGAVLPAGSQILIYNVFNHRDRARIPYADRFAPHEWVSGTAGDDWSFNFFSHGPQNCPGRHLAMLLAQTVLARIIGTVGNLTVRGARLTPSRPLPYTLGTAAIRLSCANPPG